MGLKETITDEEARAAARHHRYLAGTQPAKGPLSHAGPAADTTTPGQTFVKSDIYRFWMDQYPDGAPSRASAESRAVRVSAAAREPVPRSDVVRGRLGRSARPADSRGLLEPALMRPFAFWKSISRPSAAP